MPVIIALVVIVGLIGLANISSLVSGKKKAAPQSALPMRPATANPQQVKSFETQQQIEAKRDADDRQRQQELAAEMQQLEASQGVPGPEAAGAPPMTPAQRSAMYGDSPNAPTQDLQRLAGASGGEAEGLGKGEGASGRRQQRHRRHRLRPSSSSVAAGSPAPQTAVLGERDEMTPKSSSETLAASATEDANPPPRQSAQRSIAAAKGRREEQSDGTLRLRLLSGPALSGV